MCHVTKGHVLHAASLQRRGQLLLCAPVCQVVLIAAVAWKDACANVSSQKFTRVKVTVVTAWD